MKTTTSNRGRPVESPTGKNIVAELRRRTGWSQSELGEKLGRNKCDISFWERDLYKIPKTIEILIDRINKDLDALD